jgi:hypothetical protein
LLVSKCKETAHAPSIPFDANRVNLGEIADLVANLSSVLNDELSIDTALAIL